MFFGASLAGAAGLAAVALLALRRCAAARAPPAAHRRTAATGTLATANPLRRAGAGFKRGAARGGSEEV